MGVCALRWCNRGATRERNKMIQQVVIKLSEFTDAWRLLALYIEYLDDLVILIYLTIRRLILT